MESKKRSRSSLSCSNCKRRKSKCDRNKPCGRCIHLNNIDTCIYESDLTKSSSKNLQAASSQINTLYKPRTKKIKLPTFFVAKHSSTTEIINIIPNGTYIETKRSAVNEYALFTDRSMEHRDDYLRTMIAFRSIAVKRMLKRFKDQDKNKVLNKNPSLPNSFLPLSFFDLHESALKINQMNEVTKNYYIQHKSLFEKFAKFRKNESLKFTLDNLNVKEYLVDEKLFFDDVLPFFEKNVFSVIPIFDMKILKYELSALYDHLKKNENLVIKNFDHVVYCIILLITLLVQLSIKASKDQRSELIFDKILEIDSSKFVAIINHYIFQTKILRKCTLLQLQCLLLMKLYHWCGPEDGDGSDSQHNQILLGVIISSCKELGINWNSVLNQKTQMKLSDCTRPSYTNMKDVDYVKLYKQIWSLVLYWDRKTFLITGQECFIGKSYSFNINFIIEQPELWHTKALYIDNLILKINNLIHDFPDKVDLLQVNDTIGQIRNELTVLEKIRISDGMHLDLELNWSIHLLELSIIHAKMVSYENDTNTIKFHESIQELWNKLISIAENCHDYFFSRSNNLNVFTRFYCDRTVEITTNKLCVLLPTFILRCRRFLLLTDNDRDVMCKFLYNISSIYFNEFAFNHYKTFKKMFTAKISYKILSKPKIKDSWTIILQFLIYELKYHSKFHDSDKKGETTRISLIDRFQVLFKKVDDKGINFKEGNDILQIWNTEIFPIAMYDYNFKLDLHLNILQPFLIDRYRNSVNIFASFYDLSGSELVERAEEETVANITNNSINKETKNISTGINCTETYSNINFPTMLSQPSPFFTETTNTSPSDESNHTINSNNNDLGGSFVELALLNDMFEPLDFISLFDKQPK